MGRLSISMAQNTAMLSHVFQILQETIKTDYFRKYSTH